MGFSFNVCHCVAGYQVVPDSLIFRFVFSICMFYNLKIHCFRHSACPLSTGKQSSRFCRGPLVAGVPFFVVWGFEPVSSFGSIGFLNGPCAEGLGGKAAVRCLRRGAGGRGGRQGTVHFHWTLNGTLRNFYPKPMLWVFYVWQRIN